MRTELLGDNRGYYCGVIAAFNNNIKVLVVNFNIGGSQFQLRIS